MEITRRKDNEKELNVVELIDGEKHFKMYMTKYDELDVCFSYDKKKKGYWFQETFCVNKEDGEAYKAVDGIFASYSGDVYFDTLGANLVLYNENGNYRFLFMEDANFASNEIKCRFYDDSIENNSMKNLYKRLNGLNIEKNEPVVNKPKTLSKTLQKIVEK